VPAPSNAKRSTSDPAEPVSISAFKAGRLSTGGTTQYAYHAERADFLGSSEERSQSGRHHLSFAEAAKVFALPEQFRFTAYDGEHSTDGDRWISIGLIEKGVAIVVYVMRGPCDDEYRIISARYADPEERRAYADHLAGEAP
jgi:uncharacterized DUF497 family protein